jgi:hypothetical protein
MQYNATTTMELKKENETHLAVGGIKNINLPC